MQFALDLTVAILVTVAVLWLFYLFLISPHDGEKAASFRGKRIAHRGLHGGDVVENTLPAFQRAVEQGYGVELDIQLSSDGVAVVTHDYDLKRVFGVDRMVKDCTAAELAALGVPTLAEVLAVLDGKVPLVAELKGENGDVSVCQKAAELLDGYEGLYCVESFNPLLLRWFKKSRPAVIRGQLATRFTKKNRAGSAVLNFCLRHLLLNVLSRPHFIAYEFRYADSVSLRRCRRGGALTIGWTPKGEKEIAEAEKHFDAVIFEEKHAASSDQ